MLKPLFASHKEPSSHRAAASVAVLVVAVVVAVRWRMSYGKIRVVFIHWALVLAHRGTKAGRCRPSMGQATNLGNASGAA